MSSARKTEEKTTYHLNTKKLYRIWFSKNPNYYLTMEDQLSFIRLRKQNPDAVITFVYSSKKLSPDAQQRLKGFCKQYNLAPFDFDTELEPLLQDDQDKKMFALAQKELTEKGGNLGAASDCARLIIPLMKHCGSYSDFDVAVNFAKKPKLCPVTLPLVLPFYKATGYVNIDFVGATEDAKGEIHADSLKSIRAIQTAVIRRYKNPLHSLLNSESLVAKPYLVTNNPQAAAAAEEYFKKKPDSSIFQFREFLLSNASLIIPPMVVQLGHGMTMSLPEMTLDHEKSARFKYPLFSESICSLSGIHSYYAMFHDSLSEEKTDAGKKSKYYKLFNQYDLEDNGLHTSIKSFNKPPLPNQNTTGLKIGGDMSWSPWVAHQKSKRNEVIYKTALKIYSIWRKKKEKKSQPSTLAVTQLRPKS